MLVKDGSRGMIKVLSLASLGSGDTGEMMIGGYLFSGLADEIQRNRKGCSKHNGIDFILCLVTKQPTL